MGTFHCSRSQDGDHCLSRTGKALDELTALREKPALRNSVLAVAFAIGCSPSIPPPVTYPSSPSKLDVFTAKPNAANDDANLNPRFGPFDMQTVFYIEKSNDKDRVDYGMRLDQYCAPAGDRAVFPYWRLLQDAPPVRSHPISFIQHMAYGISEQRPVEKSRTGGKYIVQLKQVDRPIVIVSKQNGDSHCVATAYTTIQGVERARLDYIFAKVASVMSVDYVDVHGTDTKSGQPLVERLKP